MLATETVVRAAEAANAAVLVHDNKLLGYSVRCEAQEIVLHTEYRDREPYESTDVRFTGVVAYHFQGDTLNTIVFDIEEQAIADVFTDYAPLFAALKPYGWPNATDDSPAALADRWKRHGVRAFVLSASYGMTGFVLADRMEVVAVTEDSHKTFIL